MFETLKEMQLENYKHRFERGLATGELELGNLTIREFAPPLIKYRPSGKSLLYISTVGGNAQIYSDWTVSSSVLKMLGNNSNHVLFSLQLLFKAYRFTEQPLEK